MKRCTCKPAPYFAPFDVVDIACPEHGDPELSENVDRIAHALERPWPRHALRVACPKCGALPGEKCHARVREPADLLHDERIAAAG